MTECTSAVFRTYASAGFVGEEVVGGWPLMDSEASQDIRESWGPSPEDTVPAHIIMPMCWLWLEKHKYQRFLRPTLIS